MPNKIRSHETWIFDSGIMEWVKWSVTKENAQGRLCKCDISLSKIAEKALHSHAARSKHHYFMAYF